MYVNPVLVGVIGTILTEIVITIGILFIVGRNNKDENDKDSSNE